MNTPTSYRFVRRSTRSSTSIPMNLRIVPSWKMSYQPLVTSAGTRMQGYFVSTPSVAQ